MPEVLAKRGSSAVQFNDHELDTRQKEHNGHELETPRKEYNVSQPEEQLLDSGVYRCHSSLSHCPAFTTTESPTAESVSKSLRACHSQPLSMMEVNYLSWKTLLPAFECSLAPSTLSGRNHTFLDKHFLSF